MFQNENDNDNENEYILLPCNSHIKYTTNHRHKHSLLLLSFVT